MDETERLYHGSDHIVERPRLELGRPNNDYGRGFYCTRDVEMAREWACRHGGDGFANEYELDARDLEVLDLLDGTHSVLAWISILLRYRTFTLDNDIAVEARDYLVEHFAVDVSRFDVVVGYRADDSYFAYAEAFVRNGLSLEALTRAMRLGGLGEQVVLVSERAFGRLGFVRALETPAAIYGPRFTARDASAREAYRTEVRGVRTHASDLFVMDVIRKGVTEDDARLPRSVRKRRA